MLTTADAMQAPNEGPKLKTSPPPPQIPMPPATWSEDTLSLAGVDLHYYRTGSPGRPAVVLLHGGTDNGMCWYRVAQDLASEYDIVMPDARGHGRTKVHTGGVSLDQMAEDTAALIDQLDIAPAIVIGHSMGGQVGTLLAARHPHTVSRLILEEPGYQMSTGNGIRSRVLRFALNAGTRWMGTRSTAQLEGLSRRLAKTWTPEDRQTWAAAQYEFSHGPDRPKVQQIMDPHRTWSPVFSQVLQPTLLLSAEKGFVKIEEADQAVAQMPRGRHLHIRPAGHNLRRDNYIAFLGAVREFLTTAESPAAPV